jgi:hypothetical protein
MPITSFNDRQLSPVFFVSDFFDTNLDATAHLNLELAAKSLIPNCTLPNAQNALLNNFRALEISSA